MLRRIISGRGPWRRAPIIKPALTAVLWTLLVAACGNASPTPTVTYVPPQTAIPASATVNPIAPAEEGPQIREQAADAPGVSNPTQAGLAAEGQPDRDLPTVTPQPTQAQLPMLISADDGLVQRGMFFGPDVRPAPGVLLVHDRGRDRTTWDELAARLQAAGYAVLAMDLRGHGETGGGVNWPLAQDDVRVVLGQLAGLPGINHTQLVVIGAGIGANLGLNACADQVGCAGVVMLSPGLDYRGITTAEAIARLGSRPVLIVASENDDNNPADSITLDGLAAGDHQLVIYPAAGHSTDMFATEPGLLDLIPDWLRTRFPPPVLQ
jgi:pimeloyl-ACP methyl ester carboxylesterase